MQPVPRWLVIGVAYAMLGGTAAAAAVPIASGASMSEPEDQSTLPPNRCTSTELQDYARRKAFTLQLIEQRARERFEAELAAYQRQREFTDKLVAQRRQLSDSELKQFDQQVDYFVRRHEFTSHLMDERDLRDALEYARELEIVEKKRALTQQLVQSRRGSSSTPEGQTPSATPTQVPPAAHDAKAAVR